MTKQIVQMPIGKVRPYPRNPRRNDDSVDAVAESIRQFGFQSPIIVDRDRVIIAGHTRFKAAKKLGLAEVPVIVAEELTPEQAQAYRIADNSAGSKSEWDLDILADILQDLDFDMRDFGLDLIPTGDGVDFSNLEQYKDREHTEEYDAFLEKFKEKHTTDDCFTPPAIYEAVRRWAFGYFGIPEDRQIVRPFYPGGDYRRHQYPQGCLVLDNPPFSILKEIVSFYVEQGIEFLLFADARTVGWYFDIANVILPGFGIIYENGADVAAAFITNLGEDRIIVSAELNEMLDEAQPKTTADLKAYDFPKNLVTSMILGRLAKYGQNLTIRHIVPIKGFDHGEEVYGGGALVSDATAEKVEAEKVEAEKAKAEKVKIKVELSERERGGRYAE